MTNFFRGNTQPTSLQLAIEQATDGNQTGEDWAKIMKICDHVTSHEERLFFLLFFKSIRTCLRSAKETMKLIRKRLQTNPVTHGWRTIGLTLSVRSLIEYRTVDILE